MSFEFDAFVTACRFTHEGWVFALGDGTVRFEGGAVVEAHQGPILSAAVHPSGEGLVTGGDDGRVVWSRPGQASLLAEAKGRWIDAVASSPESGLIAFSAGREARIVDAADPSFLRVYPHDKTVADLAFDPKGRRLAVATYGGCALWYARIADQKPLFLKWAGSHTAVAFSPDGKFLMSAMQENQLHGWRLQDAKNLRMGGYPTKVRSLVFIAKGAALATSGSKGVVVWPFSGPNGPMGREAAEVGYEEDSFVTRAAGTPGQAIIAAGLEDGRVWAMDAAASKKVDIRKDRGAPISALAMTPDGTRIAWGDEDGAAGVASEVGLR
jgi:WD40 repeat protein